MSRRWWIVGSFGCAIAFVVSTFFVLATLFDDRTVPTAPWTSPVLLWALPVAFALAGKVMIWIAFKRTPAQIRRSRGLCERCGYDLRASAGRCPECGQPIR